MNFLLLYSIKRYCNFKSKLWRVYAGALFGAFYVFVLFLNDAGFLVSWICKIAVSVLMLEIAFSIRKIKDFIRTIVLFYIASIILSGAIFFLFYLLNTDFEAIGGSFVIKDVNPAYMIFGSILAISSIKLGFDYLEKHYKVKKEIINLKLTLQNKQICINALIDTGNSLVDPLTLKPVIIVYYEAISNILPVELFELIKENHQNKFVELKEYISCLIGKEVSIIPYKTIGTQEGRLLGFETDMIEVISKKRNITIKNGIIALYNEPISILGAYDAIAYPEIINGGI